MAPFLALALALAAAAAPPPDTTPLVFGGLAARIRDQELAGILRAVEASSPPVALYAHAAQTLPWTWFVDVFLPPAESAPGARVVRGPVEHLKCIPDDTARCLEWVPSARQSSYAQVRIGSSTKGAAAPGNGTMQERPFEVIGDLSESQRHGGRASLRARELRRDWKDEAHSDWLGSDPGHRLGSLAAEEHNEAAHRHEAPCWRETST